MSTNATDAAQKRPADELPVEGGDIVAKRARVAEESTASTTGPTEPETPIEDQISKHPETTPVKTMKTPAASASATGNTTIVTTPNSTPVPLPTQVTYNDHLSASHRILPEPVSKLGLKPAIPILPPSLEIVAGHKTDLTDRKGFVGESECGIRGFAGVGNRGIRGVIKQRFTDFLVNEVCIDGEVLHLKDITKPKEPESAPVQGKDNSDGGNEHGVTTSATPSSGAQEEGNVASTSSNARADDEIKHDDPEYPALPESLRFGAHPQWSASTTLKLRPHLSDETIIALHNLVVEGKDPPPRSDSGWGSRPSKAASGNEEDAMNEENAGNAGNGAGSGSGLGNGGGSWGGRGQGRDRGRGRGGRGGRGGGRGTQGGWRAEDDREVVSQVIKAKDERTAVHKVLRECFGSTFESSTKEIAGEEGSRVVIKYAKGGQGGGRDGFGQRRAPDKPKLPQYIHFTLHKSNRETMDALSHISRMLGAHPKDLSVCGTKDKRAVTVQRVCLKRMGKTLQSVWKAANGVKQGRRNEREAVEERGERGVRIGDVAYSDKYLELGMLRGNQFVITLRNVQEEDTAEIDKTMTSVRDRGFINFYGMQRFGTSSMPTHVTGLFILQSKWTEAVDSILSLREGEHPDCTRARLAWLEDGDFKKAYELMPRRGVAERSIWEFWGRGNRTEDKVNALMSIPRNLRAMYVHAYQSYIWNLVVSERIKMSGTEPLVGDLVFVDKNSKADGDVQDLDAIPAHMKDKHGKPVRKWTTTSSPDVKALTAEDLPNYTIFDVVVPLPGWDVDYPGGEIGELYEKLLKADGLDAHRMRRDQREFSLPGSYRRMILRPMSLQWTHIQYTDPDLSLVQSDEDAILNLNPPVANDPEGKFRALKIELTLGAATYATMCLREITREETSTWHQIGLSMRGEDREYKGSKDNAEGDGEGDGEGEGEAEGDAV
ncbi:tRNA pseudouridine13 synthase [Kwoniella heveanensis CBS 569]|uniref:tRNA pseudouridine13 synthase n=1 Tax=Kwoniella heveanensis BCC8398 TaxID=1296120 RepID=A0A1B9GQI2_9TREE|nr:tRNA pseudouridine13 synthase [Kwoniella heveanensis BCC8398]OCF44277.1 tRNA pseudouridine13 synthase [Kwoniella heveanensis CBS 569]